MPRLDLLTAPSQFRSRGQSDQTKLGSQTLPFLLGQRQDAGGRVCRDIIASIL